MKWQKRFKTFYKALLVIWLLMPAKIVFSKTIDSSVNRVVVVLKPEDPSPAAEKLSQRILTGKDFTGDCSFFELQLSAERYAQKTGADIVRIISKSSHSRTQPCDKIEVAFYRSETPHAAEQSFRWEDARPLSWDDFRGPVRAGVSDNIAAETSCGIAIETSLTSAGAAAKVYVSNTFDKRQSWVRGGYSKADVLQHEQGHWDICELYTRKMQASFNSATITGANMQQEVSRIYNSVSSDYVARQEKYEQETQHGTVASEQHRWSALIEEELAASSAGKQ